MGNVTSKHKVTGFPRIQILIIWLMLVCPIVSFGQPSTRFKNQIDALFMDWELENHPGGVVGVMQSDEVIYLNSFGNASLEHYIPS